MFEAIDVRLAPGLIPRPDIVVTVAAPCGEVTEAGEVALVVEISSPLSARLDRTYKMDAYASAGISWFLLVEPAGLDLHRLHNGAYAAHSFARAGEVLRLTEPVEATIRPEELVLPD